MQTTYSVWGKRCGLVTVAKIKLMCFSHMGILLAFGYVANGSARPVSSKLTRIIFV